LGPSPKNPSAQHAACKAHYPLSNQKAARTPCSLDAHWAKLGLLKCWNCRRCSPTPL